ncbi:MAG TPA: aspartyl protease family protein [Rhizomicrobium sp.]
MAETVSLSRRRLLRSGMGLLALAPQRLRAAAQGPADTIPASNLANQLAIDVTIAGRGPFQFVVDTGADRTVLAAEVAKALALRPGAPVVVQGIARSVPTVTVSAETFSVGSTEFGPLVVPVLPRAWIRADGYLGLDVLNHHRIVFDFARHELQLLQARPSLSPGSMARPNETVISASGDEGRLRAVDCTVDGIYVSAFLDSGAQVSVGNPPLLKALIDQRGRDGMLEPVTLTDVTGGTAVGAATPVHKVHLKGFDFSDSGLVIADLQIFRVWDLSERPALFIGMDLLRQFSRVAIDYGHKEFRFQFAELAIAQT